jgi:hypothetical protein
VFVIDMLGVVVTFYTRAGGANVGMLVGVDVDGAVVEGAAPRTMVDEDGVTAPTEASTIPTEDSKGGADGNGWSEADCGADNESTPRCEEDDRGAVDGNVVVGWVDGLNLNIAAVVDDVVVGARGEIAVVVCGSALTLDGVHDVGTLIEDCVAEGTGPLRIARHAIEHGGEGQQCQDAGIPGEAIGLNSLGERVAGEVGVLLRPRGGIGDLVPKSGSSENLGEKRIGVECDALNELVELLRGHGRRRSGLLGLLRVDRRGWRWWLVWLSLLLVGRWRRGWLADDRSLGEGDCGQSDRAENADGEFFHGLFLSMRRKRIAYPFLFRRSDYAPLNRRNFNMEVVVVQGGLAEVSGSVSGPWDLELSIFRRL